MKPICSAFEKINQTDYTFLYKNEGFFFYGGRGGGFSVLRSMMNYVNKNRKQVFSKTRNCHKYQANKHIG